MGNDAPDIRSKRLDAEAIEQNFADLHPPLGRPEALIAADRCYFCYDAPCTQACPTGIDIPRFIQQIRSDNVEGAAYTILRDNIMGGMCARVCPTEVLCEQVCVRNTHEEDPVDIGRLQRYAVDPAIRDGTQFFTRAPVSGRRVAVVGGGPAGLSCAHGLARLGHDVVVFVRDEKPGGLNEYGIAAYKTVDDFARREVAYLLGIGGIEIRCGVTLGDQVSLDGLRDEFDAVFVAVGLGSVGRLGIEGEDLAGVANAVDYIAGLRQAGDRSELPVARRIVVIGGGMTAIDIAVQSRRLGAEDVTLVYRRGPAQMAASLEERHLAQTSGVTIRYQAEPLRILGDGHVRAVEFALNDADDAGTLRRTGETVIIDADMVFKAIGQKLVTTGLDALAMEGGKIVTDDRQATSVAGVWAGGDCATGGDDLTVTAVQQGKVAAADIDRYLAAVAGE